MIGEFILGHIGTILAVIAGLGGIGTIAAIVLFGVPAVIILDKAIGVFSAMLRFFSTPLGQKIGYGLLITAAFLVGGVYEGRRELARCEIRVAVINKEWQAKVDEAAKQFAAARSDRDKAVDADLADLVAKKAAEVSTLQQKVDAYEGSDHPACVLGPADLDRVRGTEPTQPAAKPKPARKPGWGFIGHGS